MTKLVVLVHGLGADAETFWGSTREALTSHPDLENYDIKFWRYRTIKRPIPFWQKIPGLGWRYENIKQLGEHLWSDLDYWYGKGQYSEIKLLGHSMGGLVVVAAIGYSSIHNRDNSNDYSLMRALQGIALVGSPLKGARLADLLAFIYSFGENSQVETLRSKSNTRQQIINDFVSLNNTDNRYKIPVQIFRAANDSVVQDEELVASLLQSSDGVHVLKGGHSDCIQDLGDSSVSLEKRFNLDKLIDWMRTEVQQEKICDIEKVNGEVIEEINKISKEIECVYVNQKMEMSDRQKYKVNYLAREINSANEIQDEIERKLQLIRKYALGVLKDAKCDIEKKIRDLKSEADFSLSKSQKIKNLQDQQEGLSQFFSHLEISSKAADWLSQNSTFIARAITDFSLRKFHDKEEALEASKVEDFHFSITQFIELIAYCLEWGRTNALDYPEIPLELGIDAYKIAFSELINMTTKVKSFSDSEKQVLKEYIEYTVERLIYCPET